MFTDKYRDVRVEVAVREGSEFSGRLRLWGWVFAAVGTAILAVMAFAGISAPWLIAVSLGMIVVLLTQAQANIAERNTAALSFVETVCADIDERLEKMHWDMPTP
jgi:Ni,Fe-hydrogenase I cytochrome b subunit